MARCGLQKQSKHPSVAPSCRSKGAPQTGLQRGICVPPPPPISPRTDAGWAGLWTVRGGNLPRGHPRQRLRLRHAKRSDGFRGGVWDPDSSPLVTLSPSPASCLSSHPRGWGCGLPRRISRVGGAQSTQPGVLPTHRALLPALAGCSGAGGRRHSPLQTWPPPSPGPGPPPPPSLVS